MHVLNMILYFKYNVVLLLLFLLFLNDLGF